MPSVFQKKVHKIFLLLLLAAISTQCTGKRKLQDGQKLYTGHQINLHSEENIQNKAKLKDDLDELVKPEPNESLFGMRPRLWIYQRVKEPEKDKGIKHFLKYRIGRAPVLMRDANPGRTSELLKNHLYNKGFFQAQVEYEIEEKKKTGEIVYNAYLHSPYLIRSSVLNDTATQMGYFIKQSGSESLIKPGNVYDLEALLDERERIDTILKNQGFFYFNPDYVLFKVDSTIGGRQVDVFTTIKPNIPVKAERRYKIGEVWIFTEYSITGDSAEMFSDTLVIDGYYYVPSEKLFRGKALLKGVFFEPGKLYTREDHNLTLSRLMGFGTFNFVNIEFNEVDSAGEVGTLNVQIFLTAMKRKSVRAELQMVTKSNGYAGPGLNLNFRNRNLLRGSELFTASLEGSYELQYGGERPRPRSYEFEAETGLALPRFLVPFINVKNFKSRYVPETKFSLAFRHVNREEYFRLNSGNFTFGYNWRQTELIRHQVDPLVFSYMQAGNFTGRFQEVLETFPLLRETYRNQFIVGSRYRFTYNDQVLERLRNNFYFKADFDVAGNNLYLLKRLSTNNPPSADTPYTLMGQPFSQYLRVEFDTRYYFKISGENRIATRLVTGIGYPYGNSFSLPYIKQFFIGGTNSLRAFRARTLGPGGYLLPDSLQLSAIDQGGDIKLEANIEYRFPIVSIFKGALFVDAGNIWLARTDTLKKEAEFSFAHLPSHLAVGTGFGLRIDASFFVLRFDLAMPLRKPVRQGIDGIGEFGWLPDGVHFGQPDWRRKNLILNVAIGYPF